MKIQMHSDFLLLELSKNEQGLEQNIHYHNNFLLQKWELE